MKESHRVYVGTGNQNSSIEVEGMEITDDVDLAITSEGNQYT
jgi:hypothetical protein